MKTFEFCAHCGDQFFAEDVRRTENGPLCVRCLERGAKLVARK